MKTLEEKRLKQIEINKKSLEQYYWYKDHNVCTACKKYTAVPNKTKCEVCLLEDAIRKKQSVDSLTDEQKEKRRLRIREQERLRREKAKANGICTRCFKRKAIEGKNRCLDCSVREKRRYIKNQKQRPEIARSERRYHGLCYICGNTAMTNKSLCKDCFESRSSWMTNYNIEHKDQCTWGIY